LIYCRNATQQGADPNQPDQPPPDTDPPGPPGTGPDSPGENSGPGGDSGPGPGPAPRSGPDAGPSLAALVTITIPYQTLQGRSDAPGEAGGFGPLDGDDAAT
jgi:hypothetical protein